MTTKISNRFLRYWWCPVVFLWLSGCAAQESQLVVKPANYHPESQARIRLYGIYGRPLIRVYSGKSCDAWETTYGQRKHTRFINGLPRRVRNISIGMPDTQASVAAQQDKGIIFRDSFQERLLRAGKETVLDASFSSQTDYRSVSCRVAASFIPAAGQDYEAKLEVNEKENRCELKLNRIRGTDATNRVSSVSSEKWKNVCRDGKYSY